MKRITAMEGISRCRDITFLIFLLILAQAGCQPRHSSQLPPPTVRPVQWRYSSAVTTPIYTMSETVVNTEPALLAPAGWIPPMRLEAKRDWKGIIIHHSADEAGDAIDFDRVHKIRGWDGLGYHFVINNGNSNHGRRDGAVEVGFRWRKQLQGAHCRVSPTDDNYWNEHTIGICLVGDFEKHRPTEAQWRSLGKLIRFLQQRYAIPTSGIIGHRDVKPTKCPGKYFSFSELRRRLTVKYL